MFNWVKVAVRRWVRAYTTPPPQRYDIRMLSADLRELAWDIRNRKNDIKEHCGQDEWARVVFRVEDNIKKAYVDKAFAFVHHRELERLKCRFTALCDLRTRHRGRRRPEVKLWKGKRPWIVEGRNTHGVTYHSAWITPVEYEAVLYDLEKKYLLQRPTRYSSLTSGPREGAVNLLDSIKRA